MFHSKTTSKDSAMTNIALYSLSQDNEEGDGLVCRSDAEIPHTRVVRYDEEFDHVDPAFPTSFSDALVRDHREFYAKENERRIKRGNKMLLPTPLGIKGAELTSQVLAVPGRVKHDTLSISRVGAFSFKRTREEEEEEEGKYSKRRERGSRTRTTRNKPQKPPQ